MIKSKINTRLFEREGKQNLNGTVRVVSRAATDLDIRKIVVFTAEGDGPLALRAKLTPERKIIAVTFPHEMVANNDAGKRIVIGLSSRQRRLELQSLGVEIVQGTMPFGIGSNDQTGPLQGVRVAFGAFGGGTQMCVQAVLMACDAGHINAAERCIVMSADTALIVRSGHSSNFLNANSTFAIEHFLCKPQYYQITRGDRELRIAEFYKKQELIGTDEPSTDDLSRKEALPTGEVGFVEPAN